VRTPRGHEEAQVRVILFGATGRVGQGVLRECLLDPAVERVLAIGRSVTGQQHAKLEEVTHGDFTDLSPLAGRLAGWDACFFCLGRSAAGLTEDQYRRVTCDFALAAAAALVRASPAMTFVYVSGAGTDSTEQGRWMWGRVKGRTENALLALPFAKACMVRPGLIAPMHGIRSKTGWYRALYAALTPVTPLLRRAFPGSVLTSEEVARATLVAAKEGADRRVLEAVDLARLAPRAPVRG
jgi:uncharacterized protein YbjT (DUF2867 family)